MDNQDKKLLGLMQDNASLSVAELAEQADMSKSACWRRIQKFEEQGLIRQRVTLLDPAKLGLGLTVFISIRTNQHNAAWADKFRQVVDSIEGILEVYRLGGQIDYLIKAVVADMPGYDRLYQKLIAADLFDVTASFVMEEIKNTTRLPLNSVKSIT
ncbi:MAG TPA: Lrp/AsnC family transcriptional regulator [Pseudohongiella sp.]|nr:Lrp/AsnC family transcriptional regulator [Pseudohongiella sp.]